MWVYYLIYSFFLLLVYLLHVAPHVLYTDIGDLIGSFFELLEPPAPSAPFDSFSFISLLNFGGANSKVSFDCRVTQSQRRAGIHSYRS